MMKKLMTSMALVFGLAAFSVHADTVKDAKTSHDGRTSVQTQKHDLPDSRATGDYLKKKSVKNPSEKNKAIDLDKSIRTAEDPKDGGMDLESK